jgi:integrase
LLSPNFGEPEADIHNVRSPTAELRFHDLRHHAITKLAESQASDLTVMAIASHVSQKMLRQYSHVHMEATVEQTVGLLSGLIQDKNRMRKRAYTDLCRGGNQ